jgi:glycerol-3-phosphate dehydrogenase (NAD(P)+)
MNTFSPQQVRNITVFGAGSWGTALAIYLAKKGFHVLLWHNVEADAMRMEQARQNEVFLPGITFPDSLHCSSDLAQAVSQADLLLVVVPSHVFRQVLQQIKPYIKNNQALIWATKGIDSASNQLLDQVAEEVFGKEIILGVLSGPNFATEVARGLPDATTLACRDARHLTGLCQIFASNLMQVDGTTDVTGTEIGGAVKNVIAIAVGVFDGLQLGANARSVLMTRGLAEIISLGQAAGAKAETMIGLSGVGDLILTCTDDQSRNRRFGLMLGRNQSVDEALQAIAQVVEGYTNVKEVLAFSKRFNLKMPIVEAVYQLCYEGMSPKELNDKFWS